MAQKERKTLYLPPWISEILDFEGEKYDGPGIVAASAIHYFSIQNTKNKKNILKEYRSKEIENAYKDETVAAQTLSEPGYNERAHKSLKSG